MISAKELRNRFYYYKSTGKWQVRIGRKREIVGHLHSTGYVHIQIGGRIYKAHRLAWLYITGEFPPEDIEHKNLIKSDNRWKNLRLGNDSLNQANVRKRVDNTVGFKSVSYRLDSKKWRARIQVRKKRYALGSFNTPEEAHAAYVKAAKKYFGEFARAA